MKKSFLWLCIAFMLMLMFTGCPPDVGDIRVQGVLTGLNDFYVWAGEKAGELTFSFAATNPAATIYHIYFLQGSESDSQIIIHEGRENRRQVRPSLFYELGTINDLASGTLYSFVVVARRDGFANLISPIRQATTIVSTAPTGIQIYPPAVFLSLGKTQIFSATIEQPPDGEPNVIEWSVYPSGLATITRSHNSQEATLEVGAAAQIGDVITVTAAIQGTSITASAMITIAVADIIVALESLIVRRGGVNPIGTQGAINHIELTYYFDAFVPEEYDLILYFVAGAEQNTASIINNGTARLIEPRTAASPGYIIGPGIGTGPNDAGFSVNGTYSVVVVARRAGSEDLVSAVTHIERVPNNIMTVSGNINPNIIVSALIDVLNPARPDTYAVGYRIPGTGMFVFYLLDGDCLGPENPDSGQYDPTQPWTGEGSLFITLSTGEGVGAGYRQYIQGTRIPIINLPLPARQNIFRNTDRETRTWSNFVFNPL